MEARIQRLRDKVLNADDRTVFVERYRYLKHAYAKFRDYPTEIRHALITKDILSNISIPIDPDDLIVGRVLETIPAPEEEALLNELWNIETDQLPPLLFTYAAKPEVYSKVFPSGSTPFGPYNGVPNPSFYSTGGHVIPDWEGLLQRGMKGIKERAEESLRNLRNDENKKHFLEAAIISCDAVIIYAEKCVKTLDRELQRCRNIERKSELSSMKEILARVPVNPAESFHEALQSIWILDLILHQVIGARDFALGRADQYLYPFYRKDITEGVISEPEAMELLQMFFLKQNEVTSVVSHMHGAPVFKFSKTQVTKRSLCLDSIQYCTIGGQKSDRTDASNELSLLILQAADELRLKQPAFVVRYHPSLDPRLWTAACDAARRGFNNIVFCSDEVMIPAYEKCGILFKDAVEYSQIACNHPGIPGRTMEMREYWFNLPKYLELTLNDGFDPVIKHQMGPNTGKCADLTSFSQFLEAFKEQSTHQIETAFRELGDFFALYFKLKPFSFESLLMKDCVEMAMDYKDFKRNPPTGTGYIFIDCLIGGLATTVDSLAAIRKLVFEDNRLSLENLNHILLADYAGNEDLRLELMNRFPKYGNDDDYVDSLAADIALFFSRLISGMRNPYFGLCLPSIYTYHSYACHGAVTGATPDGRRAGAAVSENQQAVNGMDKKGLTALFNTLSKLSPAFRYTPGGGSTITFHPTALVGKNGTRILSDLIQAYFERGGQQVQTNVVSTEELKDAKRHPERHRDLLVRVTGYSAYFVTLSPESQDNIISRVTHLH